MSKIRNICGRTPFNLSFYCPGCKSHHGINTIKDGVPKWSWNGDYNNPTISPSILVKSIEVCHSFIKNGQIEYLNDCTHDLAGKTVNMDDEE